MKRKRMFLLLMVFGLFLAACGGTAAVTPEATLVEVTPLPTATDVPPTAEPEPTAVPEPTAAPLPTAEESIVQPPADELAEKIDAFMSQQAKDNRFSGAVLVVRGDEIILSDGYGLADRENDIPNAPTTRFRIGSLTKAFTAVAIMQLQEQGKLDVNDPICDYLDDCPAAWEAITIHHLLVHSSGIFNFTDDYQLMNVTVPSSPDQVIGIVADRPLDFEPGSAWSYSNTGYLLLGLIIERVSGQSYEAFLQENIFDPLGMVDTGYDHNRDDLAVGYVNRYQTAAEIDMSVPFAAGALYSTVEDFYRWTQAVQSDELVSRETLDLIFTPHMLMEPDGEWSYGYGWFIGQIHERPVVGHGGGIDGFRSDLNIFPEDEVTTVVFTNREDVNPEIYGEILSKWALGIE
jgi:CubicO group peptidase (beta-lactamase class C family)